MIDRSSVVESVDVERLQLPLCHLDNVDQFGWQERVMTRHSEPPRSESDVQSARREFDVSLLFLDDEIHRKFAFSFSLILSDVAPVLADLIQIISQPEMTFGLKFNEVYISPGETIIDIPAFSCCDTTEFFDLQFCEQLREIRIGTCSFERVSKLHICGLKDLRSVYFGSRSFTTSTNPNPRGEFKIADCPSLESITLCPFSFTHFTDLFLLSNLPKLKTLQIGCIGDYSSNFYKASCCIKGPIAPLFPSRSAQSGEYRVRQRGLPVLNTYRVRK